MQSEKLNLTLKFETFLSLSLSFLNKEFCFATVAAAAWHHHHLSLWYPSLLVASCYHRPPLFHLLWAKLGKINAEKIRFSSWKKAQNKNKESKKTTFELLIKKLGNILEKKWYYLKSLCCSCYSRTWSKLEDFENERERERAGLWESESEALRKD